VGRSLRGRRGQSSLVLLLVLLEDRAEGLVVQVVRLHSLDHRLQVQRQLELALHDLHQGALVHHSRLVRPAAQRHEGVH
jgi:hypothetical protein